LGKQLAQHDPRPGIEGHIKMDVKPVLSAIGSLTGQGEPVPLRLHEIHLDFCEALELGRVHAATSCSS